MKKKKLEAKLTRTKKKLVKARAQLGELMSALAEKQKPAPPASLPAAAPPPASPAKASASPASAAPAKPAAKSKAAVKAPAKPEPKSATKS